MAKVQNLPKAQAQDFTQEVEAQAQAQPAQTSAASSRRIYCSVYINDGENSTLLQVTSFSMSGRKVPTEFTSDKRESCWRIVDDRLIRKAHELVVAKKLQPGEAIWLTEWTTEESPFRFELHFYDKDTPKFYRDEPKSSGKGSAPEDNLKSLMDLMYSM